ncbi:hypothetical protein VNO77_07773 [Canavalia gladiata]|uniref:Uncharacterized protein n=1 Tax=Canavalia gladiata TaxID=3824 RepID=A0AAN9MDG6_CANGL
MTMLIILHNDSQRFTVAGSFSWPSFSLPLSSKKGFLNLSLRTSIRHYSSLEGTLEKYLWILLIFHYSVGNSW